MKCAVENSKMGREKIVKSIEIDWSLVMPQFIQFINKIMCVRCPLLQGSRALEVPGFLMVSHAI